MLSRNFGPTGTGKKLERHFKAERTALRYRARP